jgi:hypothetical protein
MKTSLRRLIFLALLAAALTGCAGTPDLLQPNAQLQCKPEDGIGGTGISAVDRGMGGTGVLAQDRGMGGTGISIGVIGTVTGFGSICVNGVHIAYDANTPITENGTPVGAGALALGHVVAISAIESNGQLAAKSIFLAHALTGPLTSAPDSTGVFKVMGVPVRSVFAAGLDINSLTVGDIVTVDGLPHKDGTIDASRIVRAPTDAAAFVRGTVEGSSGAIRIGSVPVAPPTNQRTNLTDLDGQWAVAEGTWANDRLSANTLAVGAELSAANISRLSVEGYLIGGDEGSYMVRGIPVREDARRQLKRTTLDRLAEGQRVQVIGRVESDGALSIQTIVVPNYLSPLQNDAPSESPNTSEEASDSRSATQTRDDLQQDTGTYGAVDTRPNVLDNSATDIRTDSLRDRPIQDRIRPIQDRARPIQDLRPDVPRPPPPPTRRR